MNVLLFGATGMIGRGVLLECLDDSRVSAVLAVGRRPTGLTHPKLRELTRTDFFDYSDCTAQLTGHDACFFCLGVSSAGMGEPDYTRLTYDLTIAAADALLRLNPDLVFCYVSGQGTDPTERGRFMWARVKGRTENRLLGMSARAYMFRPGYVQPMKGVRSSTTLYDVFYRAAGPLFPLIRRIWPRQVTTTENVGRAMIEVAARGYSGRILENPDINALANTGGGRE
jgi:uncharacterized protein YbjT (DUF2867 family)